MRIASLKFCFLVFCSYFAPYAALFFFSIGVIVITNSKQLYTLRSFRNIINDFYILLTIGTAIITIYATFIFSMHFYVMAGVWFMIVLILVFLMYLRHTQPFQYAVISQELPRLPPTRFTPSRTSYNQWHGIYICGGDL